MRRLLNSKNICSLARWIKCCKIQQHESKLQILISMEGRRSAFREHLLTRDCTWKISTQESPLVSNIKEHNYVHGSSISFRFQLWFYEYTIWIKRRSSYRKKWRGIPMKRRINLKSTRTFNWYVSTLTEVFVNQMRTQ